MFCDHGQQTMAQKLHDDYVHHQQVFFLRPVTLSQPNSFWSFVGGHLPKIPKKSDLLIHCFSLLGREFLEKNYIKNSYKRKWCVFNVSKLLLPSHSFSFRLPALSCSAWIITASEPHFSSS